MKSTQERLDFLEEKLQALYEDWAGLADANNNNGDVVFQLQELVESVTSNLLVLSVMLDQAGVIDIKELEENQKGVAHAIKCQRIKASFEKKSSEETKD
jgi:hypothetical protein